MGMEFNHKFTTKPIFRIYPANLAISTWSNLLQLSSNFEKSLLGAFIQLNNLIFGFKAICLQESPYNPKTDVQMRGFFSLLFFLNKIKIVGLEVMPQVETSTNIEKLRKIICNF